MTRLGRNCAIDFFDRIHRVRPGDPRLPPEMRFAGANARIPQDVRTVLDIGCGRGEFLRWLGSGYQRVGLDFSMYAIAGLEWPCVLGAAERLPFAAASFDLVACFEVLEHVRPANFKATLDEIARVSRKYVLLSVPNQEPLGESLVRCPQCLCRFNGSWHVRRFDEHDLRTLFRGFQLLECRACGPVTRYGGSRLAEIAVLLRGLRPAVGVTCPLCGHVEVDAAGSTGKKKRTSAIHRGLRTLLFYRSRPYWLLALYARRD